MPFVKTPKGAGDAEQRITDIGIELPSPPTPFGAYAEAVRSGNFLFLSGTLPVLNGRPQYRGRLGTDLNAEQAWSATRLAALNALAIAREHLGSLNHISRIVRLGVMLATGDDS